MYYCLMPKNILEENKEIKYIYREIPVDDKDSGWRFFAGDETDNHNENLMLYNVFKIIKNKKVISIDCQNISFFMQEESYGCAYKKMGNENLSILITLLKKNVFILKTYKIHMMNFLMSRLVNRHY